MEYSKKFVSLMDMINRSVEMNSVYAEGYDVTCEVTDNSCNATVVVDEDRLVQVLTNLLSNAAKFSPKGSNVVISTFCNDGKVVISVEDKGEGIPEEFRDRIFARFTQADSSDTRAVGGTGPGLNISKSIIEQHDGDIWFDTEVGKGSTFRFPLNMAA